MSENAAAVITWPEGTAALDIHALVMTCAAVFVEVGGKRFRLTDWDEQARMFTAVGPLGPTE